VVTRRDQLSIKRPPPSKRSKGRGKGKGGRGGRGRKGGKGGKSKGSSGKSPPTKASKAKKLKQDTQHDVEDEEVSEDKGIPKGNETANPEKEKPSRTRKAKAKAKPKAVPKAKAKTGAGDGANQKRKHAAETPNDENQMDESTSRIKEYVEKIDMGLDGDDFKNDCRRYVPDLGQGQLNIYWTKHSCGLRWRIGRTTQDVHCFSFKRGFVGTPSLKQAVAIGTSIELVAWQVVTKS